MSREWFCRFSLCLFVLYSFMFLFIHVCLYSCLFCLHSCLFVFLTSRSRGGSSFELDLVLKRKREKEKNQKEMNKENKEKYSCLCVFTNYQKPFLSQVLLHKLFVLLIPINLYSCLFFLCFNSFMFVSFNGLYVRFISGCCF